MASTAPRIHWNASGFSPVKWMSAFVSRKAAGRAPKEADDALWQRFRAAQQSFFNRRSSVFAERDAEFAQNAARKEQLLAEAPADAPKLVAFESVYSMDGDIADVAATAAIARKFGALTYLNEVHAVGLYGHRGGGVTDRDLELLGWTASQVKLIGADANLRAQALAGATV